MAEYRRFNTSKELGDYLRFENRDRFYVHNDALGYDLPMDKDAFIRALDCRTLPGGASWEVYIVAGIKVVFVGLGD